VLATFTHRSSKQERIYFGRPAAHAVAEEVALCRAERVLLLTNRSLARETTLVSSIAQALGARCAGQITDLMAYSPSEDVLRVANTVRELKADMLLAVGGGSVIDTTKVALVAVNEALTTLSQLSNISTYAKIDQSMWQPREGELRFIAVPTTLSSAEFSWGASFVDQQAVKKYAVGHPLMAPQAVVLDPRATLTAPDNLFFSTGMKSVDHAAERLASLLGNPYSDANSTQALVLLNHSLRRAKVDRTDLAARLDAQVGTWLSVIGQTSGVPVGASHPIGRILSLIGNLPHGLTTCVILPAVMRWNASVNADRQQLIAAALGEAYLPAADAITNLVKALGLPERLREMGADPKIFEEVARKSVGEGSIRTNPRTIKSESDIVEILQLAW
jgi:maleylacetate reductase